MTNRHDRLRTASAIAAATSLIATIALTAPATGRDANESATPGNIEVFEHETLPVPGLGPLTVHVWRRGTEVQVAALDERGAMVVLRAGTIDDTAPAAAAAMPGRLSARTRYIGADRTATVEECANERCARAVAERASAVAAGAHLIPYTGSPDRSLAVRMCPAEGAHTATRSSIPHWMRAGAEVPCKWQIVPAATLAAWPVAGRSERIWIGDTMFRIHRAPLRLIHGR
ncbi:MAG: hypothetical protein OXU81_13695 [Gammaproteobacteria bacterium]|nr:hypothetical protein [Gammaproteobacteria bacterium]